MVMNKDTTVLLDLASASFQQLPETIQKPHKTVTSPELKQEKKFEEVDQGD